LEEHHNKELADIK